MRDNNIAISKKYNLCETTEYLKWDNFVMHSKNPCIFSLTKYLVYSNNKFKLFYVKKGNDIFAGIVLLISEDEKNIIFNRDILYTPIILNNIMFDNKSIGSINSEIYSIIYNIYFFLIENFKDIDLTLDHSTLDIRPFIWHNFYNKNEKFEIYPRYTSIIKNEQDNIEDFTSSNIFKNFTTTKRKEYRRSLSEQYILGDDLNKNEFLKLSYDTFKKQNISIDNLHYEKLYSLLSYFEIQKIIKFYKLLNKDNEVINFNVVSTINKTSCFLFSGRIGSTSHSNAGTLLYCSIFQDLVRKNINSFDLEGVNSPLRAFNKISYGGKVLPYYRVILRRD